jgi:16S rRNA (guanine527-N7)-methyltransferase
MTAKLSLDANLKQCLAALGLQMDEPVRTKLLIYQEELLRWNKKVNLTAVCAPQESIEKNLADSLTVLPFIAENSQLLDIGSGAGLPGIPIAAARSDLKVVSLEAVAKKVHFQRHAARVLGLPNFKAYQGRIEDYAPLLEKEGKFDLVIARALTELPQLLTWASPYLRGSGLLIAMKGPREGDLSEADGENNLQNFVLRENQQIVLPVSKARRHLLIFEKR